MSCIDGQPYGSYKNLLAAKHACNDDVNCESVLDVGCGYDGTFKLCPWGSSLPSTVGSCIHVDENRSDGKC